METAAKLRAEAACLRDIVRRVRDPAEVSAINAMIEELERRARAMGDGNAGGA